MKICYYCEKILDEKRICEICEDCYKELWVEQNLTLKEMETRRK